ncbi:hypothetical protein FQR65_LT12165 [Abscondita terminalis]|nr:hypothetical protein FQR65_LT12165 [Abscondita terminalis]
MSYEREQERLRKLWEAICNEDECVPDDQDDVEVCNKDSESEQEFEPELSKNRNLDLGPSPSRKFMDAFFTGKDKQTKWNKHPPNQNVKSRTKNIIPHLPGVKGPVRTSEVIFWIFVVTLRDIISAEQSDDWACTVAVVESGVG